MGEGDPFPMERAVRLAQRWAGVPPPCSHERTTMTNDNIKQALRCVTHVRAIVPDVTATPDPEVRAIARVDMFVNTRSVVKHLPATRVFCTTADEPTFGLAACTPVSLASTICLPRPPEILLGYDSSTWDLFTPALTRNILRIDMGKVARLLWPEGPAYDLLKMADYVVYDCPERVCDGDKADRLTVQVQALADIFSAAVLTAEERLAELTAAKARSKAQGLGITSRSKPGDPRLAAMTLLSAKAMPPLNRIPDPWDGAEGWFNLANEDLAWIAVDRQATRWERDSAVAELERRKVRDEAHAQLQPRLHLVQSD